MRLLSRVERIEGRLATERRAVALVWTEDEALLDPEDLAEGEHLAVDVHLVAAGGEGGDLPARWVCAERVSRDPADLGVVYDAGDVAVGRVVDVDGSLVSLVLDASLAAEVSL